MKTLCRWLCLGCLLWATLGHAQQPIIFFTDLIAGPNSGNSDTTYGSTGGAYVTLYGNFLDNFTSVKLNGASCLTVVSNPSVWLWYERMIVKLGTSCTSGNFSITTPSGTWNGPTVATTNAVTMFGWQNIDFTVTSGVIRYVSLSGNDSNAGTYQSPWRHPYYAFHTLTGTPGNVVYMMAGTYPEEDTFGSWGACINPNPGENRGTASQPNALVGYPGQSAQVCTDTGSTGLNGIRSADQTAWTVQHEGYWTFAEFALRSGTSAGPMQNAGGAPPNYQSEGYRYVGLDVASPNAGDNGVSQFQPGLTKYNQVLGTYNHDATPKATSRLNQALYPSTDADYMDIGWNEVYNSGGRSGIQLHSSPQGGGTGLDNRDVWIHDNKIHHIPDECVLIDTPAPQLGTGIRVYNNVMYDCSTDSTGGANGIFIWEYSGDPCTIGTSPAPMWFYNNSAYVSSSYGDQYGGVWKTYTLAGGMCGQPSVKVVLSNNIVMASSNSPWPYFVLENYVDQTCADNATLSNCPPTTGTNNLIYGKGGAQYPNLLSTTIHPSSSPVTNLSGFDFHLSNGSAAIGAGVNTIVDQTGNNSVTAPTYDIDGRIRPNPPSIGAYEFGSGSSASRPNPPTNLTVAVQ